MYCVILSYGTLKCKFFFALTDGAQTRGIQQKDQCRRYVPKCSRNGGEDACRRKTDADEAQRTPEDFILLDFGACTPRHADEDRDRVQVIAEDDRIGGGGTAAQCIRMLLPCAAHR